MSSGNPTILSIQWRWIRLPRSEHHSLHGRKSLEDLGRGKELEGEVTLENELGILMEIDLASLLKAKNLQEHTHVTEKGETIHD